MKYALLLAALTSCSSAYADTPKKIPIAVTKLGFEPDNITVPANKEVTLVFTRKTDRTCTKEVVIDLPGNKIEKKLPLDTPVEIVVKFPKAGKLAYACGMNMNKGTIVVQ